MGAQFLGIAGDILTIKVTGRLERAELAEAQRLATAAIRKHGPVRILVLSEDFRGWAKGGDWGDLSFKWTTTSTSPRWLSSPRRIGRT